MGKDKLYTVNRWNRPAFMPKENIFDWGGLAVKDRAVNPWNYADDVDTTQQYMQSKGGLFNLSKANNPFSKGNLQAAGKGLLSGLAGGLGTAVGGLAGNAVAGGLQSGAGSTISNIGGMAASAIGSVNPLAGAIVGVGSQLLGGLTNRAFGSKLNKDNINQVNQSISDIRSGGQAVAGATTTDDLLANAGNMSSGFDFSNSYIGKDGWFSNKAKRKAQELRNKQEAARAFAAHSLATSAGNVDSMLDDTAMSNFSAFGGPIDTMPMNRDMGGAIDYGFMSDYLTIKNRQAQNKDKAMNPFMGIPNGLFAFGGDMQVGGSDFPSGLTHIDAGGSHEENPNEGVQMGIDGEGVPNLVEENETVFNDYVYSDRIKCDMETKRKFHLPKKRDISFAELSKKLESEVKERPNDPISKASFKAMLSTLADEQERQKQELEAERARQAFESLSPEEQTALMQQAAQQEAVAQQQAMQEQAAIQQPSQEEMLLAQQQMQVDGSQAIVGQEPQMNAMGGKLFASGGYLWDKFWSPVNEYSKKKGNTKGKYQIDKEWKGNIKELENSDAYKAFTNYILNDATDEERMKYFQWIDANTGRDNKYITDGKLVDNWKDMYQTARTDGLYGIQHYTPEWQAAEAIQEPPVLTSPSPTSTSRVFHAMDGDLYDGYIEGELGPNVGAEVRRETLPNGDTVIYPSLADNTASTEDEKSTLTPVHRAEWPRYAGLFGPAVGLGLMAAGVGKPNTSQMDAAVENAGNVALADYKPLGNYLTYRPMDIWYEQNRLNANARATDRAILNASNGNSGTAMAGLLASGYNDQIASGNLYRQALEYNDNLRKQVAEFNRGTDQFNADAYNRTSQFNASALNQGRQHRSSLSLQAAQQKMDADAGWAQGIYGNLSGLFKGISDLGRENTEANWRNALATAGAFGVIDGDVLVRAGYAKRNKKSRGGKIKRGLTY